MPIPAFLRPAAKPFGDFGLEAEHYEASMAMAEISLLPAVRAFAADTPIIANGFSCRHRIAHGTGRSSRHIAVLPRDALALNRADRGTGLLRLTSAFAISVRSRRRGAG